MIIHNITNSLINFIPEVILFTMSMVILLAGTFECLKKYVFHLTVLSVIAASLIGINYLSTDSHLLFNSSLIALYNSGSATAKLSSKKLL